MLKYNYKEVKCKMERIDKIISTQTGYTRREVKELIKEELVAENHALMMYSPFLPENIEDNHNTYDK